MVLWLMPLMLKNHVLIRIFTLLLWVFAANLCIIKNCSADTITKKSHSCCGHEQSKDDCCKTGKCINLTKPEKSEINFSKLDLPIIFVITNTVSAFTSSYYTPKKLILEKPAYSQTEPFLKTFYSNAPPRNT